MHYRGVEYLDGLAIDLSHTMSDFDIVGSFSRRAQLGRYLWFRKHILPPPATILDVGCGHLQMTVATLGEAIINGSDLHLRSTSCYSGVEADERIIDEVYKNSNIILHKVWLGKESLPFHNNSYNTVVAGEVMEHIPHNRWEFTLQELYRVAKNQVLFSIPLDKGTFGEDDELEAHSFCPGEGQLRLTLDECGFSHFTVEAINHIDIDIRGFVYARLIKKEWWL